MQMTKMKRNGKAELLSPAGDPEKMRAAVLYGADAVYLAGKRFGMRAASGNFTDGEIAEAVEYCHERDVRVYVTVNVMPRTDEYGELRLGDRGDAVTALQRRLWPRDAA